VERKSRLSWYANRLRSMSGAEVVHRAGEFGKRALSKYHRPHFGAAYAQDAKLPLIPGLLDDVREVAAAPGLIQTWREIAARAQAGRLCLLGQSWPGLSGPQKWHFDPAMGKCWPSDRYCYDIGYRHAPGFGDIKYVWELNRLQYLQPIAALAAITGNAADRQFCVNEIDCWIRFNRPFRGVNWASGIELALRVTSLIVVISLLGEGAFTQAQRHRINACLVAHGYWLMRYPSRFSSANNHLIAEAGGLYLLGSLLPELHEARQQADYGRQVLCREASLQILEDGVGAEQSPTYLAFSLEWLLLYRKIAKQLDDPFPPALDQRLADAGRFLRWITDSAGNQPRIGDDDEGRVLYGGEETGYVSSILGCVASALDDPNLVPPGVGAHFRNGVLGSPPRSSKPERGSPIGVGTFARGGYSVLRWKADDTEGLWVFDRGPLGYLTIAAHGHADALSVWLHLAGRPVLVDAGTYLYHAGGTWRDHFRGTLAHNTLAIDAADSSEITGAFNWGRKADVLVCSRNDDPHAWHVEFEHNGYEETHGVRHRRRLERTGENTFAIRDSLRGSDGAYPVSVGFLLHPDLKVLEKPKAWEVEIHSRLRLEVAHEGPLLGAIRKGEEDTHRGWYSSTFGSKQPARRLEFSGDLSAGEECRFEFTISTTQPTGAD